jgi:hypothetical protein
MKEAIIKTYINLSEQKKSKQHTTTVLIAAIAQDYVIISMTG